MTMDHLLTVTRLSKRYGRNGEIHAVDDVSFTIGRGEIVAMVGESGCGKSTVALSVLGLIEPSGGDIMFDGAEISAPQMRRSADWRRQMSIVFQNPYSSLNPRMRVVDLVGEPLRLGQPLSKKALREKVAKQLTDVGLNEAHLDRFPHQFSGGQRQRIAIARALALRPRLLILDEPTAALDVSVQAQILNLLRDIQSEHDLSYLFISHNLATVESVADRVLVMYLGRIVEEGPVAEVFRRPRHPYTRALLDSVPNIDDHEPMQTTVEGEPPSPLSRPPGCAFNRRCARATDRCRQEVPQLSGDALHRAACFHPLAG
jgi:oligopeptide/dipeptide ABC transporter ATP-binding protein